MTHAEAGDNKDGLDTYSKYGPEGTTERWDLWCYVNPSNGNITTAHLDGNGLTAPAPAGLLYMPDYIRTEVFLKIQEDTDRYWNPKHGKGM
jgi:hypothetical protein